MRLRKLTLALTALTALSVSTIIAPLSHAADLTIEGSGEEAFCYVDLTDAERLEYKEATVAASKKIIENVKKAVPNAAADIAYLESTDGVDEDKVAAAQGRLESEALKAGFRPANDQETGSHALSEVTQVLFIASFLPLGLEGEDVGNSEFAFVEAKAYIETGAISSKYAAEFSEVALKVLKPLIDIEESYISAAQACVDNKPGSYPLSFKVDDNNPGDTTPPEDDDKPGLSSGSSGFSFGSS